MVRSIAAVVAGFATMAVSVVVGTWIAAIALLGPDTTGAGSQPSAAYLAANLLESALAAVAGGYVAARLGKSSPRKHAAALAAVVLALSVLTMAAEGPAPGQPGWYRLALLVIGVGGALIGGWLRPVPAES
jgi:hypothetical protein